MKIGIEVQRLFRKNKFGIESSSLELIKNLVAADHRTEFVVLAKDDADRRCLEETENLSIRTVKGAMFIDFEQVFLPLASRREGIDLLHCTGNTAPYFSPVPVVQTLHDVIFMDPIPSTDTPYQRFGNYYRRKMVPLITPRSKAIITVSEYEKNRIVHRLGLDPARIQVIYNGLNEKRFNAVRDERGIQRLKTRYNLPEKYILFLGNQSSRKNVPRAVEAYVRYAAKNPTPLPLVTPGLSEHFVADILHRLNYPFRRDQFCTPGYIQDEDLTPLYQASTMFLFPSLSEGFGMPIVEAMACGTPVITSDASCMPEIAGNAALLVDPFNTAQMAAALSTLALDDSLRAAKIKEGLINSQRFRWSQSARRVLSVYESVLQQAPAVKRAAFTEKHILPQRP